MVKITEFQRGQYMEWVTFQEDGNKYKFRGKISQVNRVMNSIVLENVFDLQENVEWDGVEEIEVGKIQDFQLDKSKDESHRFKKEKLTKEMKIRRVSNKDEPSHLKKKIPADMQEMLSKNTQDTCLNWNDNRFEYPDDDTINGCYFFNNPNDPKIQEAFEDLLHQSVIGVSFEGQNLSRFGKLSLIAFCTLQDVIYIFDVVVLKKALWMKTIEEILESEDIQKVLHDCRAPSDLLKHLYEIDLEHVFDTLAFYTLIEGTKKSYPSLYAISYANLVNIYLQIDSNRIYKTGYRVQHFELDTAIWLQRPLPNRLVLVAAFNVRHLLDLKLKLNESMSQKSDFMPNPRRETHFLGHPFYYSRDIVNAKTFQKEDKASSSDLHRLQK